VAYADEHGRREAAIILTARKGYVRAARGLVGKAIRKALGVKNWYADPHVVTYDSAAALKAVDGFDMEPRFTLYATDEEIEKVYQEMRRLAHEGGWNGVPVEIYHD